MNAHVAKYVLNNTNAGMYSTTIQQVLNHWVGSSFADAAQWIETIEDSKERLDSEYVPVFWVPEAADLGKAMRLSARSTSQTGYS